MAVLKSSKKGCKVLNSLRELHFYIFQIKLAGAVKAGRGFGISFNEGGHVWFRMFFDTTFKKLHLCKNDDAEIIGSQDCSFDFTSLFKLKISIGTTLEVRDLLNEIELNLWRLQIKIKDGPNYSVNNITEFLDPVDLVSVHGDLVVIKATFTKFTISSNEETIQSFSQQRPPPLIRLYRGYSFITASKHLQKSVCGRAYKPRISSFVSTSFVDADLFRSDHRR